MGFEQFAFPWLEGVVEKEETEMSNKFKHRGEDIEVDESPQFKEKDYTVSGNGKMVYKASSRHGKSYAPNPDKAVEGAKEQIDKAKDGE